MWICSCLWKSWVIHHKGNNPKKIHRMWFHAEQPLWAAAPRLRATEQLPLGVRLPASSCVSTFRLFSVNELWMLCCDTNTSSLHLEGSVLSSVISYSFRSRVACNDNEHFQGSHTWRAVSHLSERMHLSNGRNTDSNINNTILSELLFKTLSHSHNKPPGFRRQILGSGKVGDDRWSSLWDGVHKVRRWYVSTGQSSPLLQNHCSEMTFLFEPHTQMAPDVQGDRVIYAPWLN